ncbi:MAG: amidase, partial [Candidatus Acidiferrales bacterium]
MDDIVYSSLIDMAEGVRARKVSPVELTDAHLSRIHELNPKLNAFVTVDGDRARDQAKLAESALGSSAKSNSIGPLHGVPISIKSSIDVAGLACECGSVLRKGNVPSESAPLVKRLRAAGAIVLGNTNVPEFLMAYETDNLLYGRTNNPWDLSRTPGGSSGGEAAAIASGCSA